MPGKSPTPTQLLDEMLRGPPWVDDSLWAAATIIPRVGSRWVGTTEANRGQRVSVQEIAPGTFEDPNVLCTTGDADAYTFVMTTSSFVRAFRPGEPVDDPVDDP